MPPRKQEPRTFTVVQQSAGGPKVTKRIETELIPWLLNNPNDAETCAVIGSDGNEYRLVNHPTLEPVDAPEQQPPKKCTRRTKAQIAADKLAGEAKPQEAKGNGAKGTKFDENFKKEQAHAE